MTRLGPSVCRDLNGRYQAITVICEAKSAGLYSGTAVLQLPVKLVVTKFGRSGETHMRCVSPLIISACRPCRHLCLA
jgi:hypothetical protein